MKNSFQSASSLHHKKVLALRCKVLVLNTRFGLDIKVLILVLKKVLITSLPSVNMELSRCVFMHAVSCILSIASFYLSGCLSIGTVCVSSLHAPII